MPAHFVMFHLFVLITVFERPIRILPKVGLGSIGQYITLRFLRGSSVIVHKDLKVSLSNDPL